VHLLDGDIEALKAAVIACIGPTTQKAASNVGLPVAVVPAESTVEALVAALAAFRPNTDNERADLQTAGVGEMAER
jgi:uroporphyrinogen-III synthase